MTFAHDACFGRSSSKYIGDGVFDRKAYDRAIGIASEDKVELRDLPKGSLRKEQNFIYRAALGRACFAAIGIIITSPSIKSANSGFRYGLLLTRLCAAQL